MEFDKKYIRKLLNLYEEGESTLEQERTLKSYFSSNTYDKNFEDYAMLFQFFEAESSTRSSAEFTIPKEKASRSWLGIAATICILIGALWFYQYQDKQQQIEEARVAFEKTQNAINLLSINMNEGLEKLEYVEVFSEQKNKILK